MLLRHWRPLVALPVVGGVLAVFIGLLLPRQYTAQARFVPEVQSGPDLSGILADLATQFGVSADPAGLSQSPSFYGELLRSRELQTELLTSRFAAPLTEDGESADSANLLDLLDVRGESPQLRVANGLLRLRELVAVAVAGGPASSRLT